MEQEKIGRACKYCRYWSVASAPADRGVCEARIVLPQWFVEAVEQLEHTSAVTHEYYGRDCESFKERIDERKD